MNSVKVVEGKHEKVNFEEALTMAGFGRYNVINVMLTSIMIMAMAYETMSVAYLVPASACELQTTSANQGVMAGMSLFGILTASNVWGYLADTRGRRKILLASLALGFVTGMSATLSPNWIVFCILKFLSSSSMAGVYGLSLTYMSECTPLHRRFTLILMTTSIFLVSSGSLAALTIPILPLTFSYHIPVLDIQFNSWRLLNMIYSLPCLVASIAIYFGLESPKFLVNIGEQEKALEVLKKIYVINTGRSADNYKVEHVTLDEDSVPVAKGMWASIVMQTTPLLRPPLLSKTLLLSVIFITVYFCLNPFAVWLPYMIDGFMKSLEKGETGLTFCEMLRSSQNDSSHDEPSGCTLNQSAMTLMFGMNMILASVNVVLAGLQPLLGRKTLLIGIQLISGICALSVNACTAWAATAGLMVVYVGGVLNFGYLSTFSVDLFPTYVKAMGVCLTLMVGRGSAVLGINILKKLLDTNCESSFYIFGSITIAGGFIGFLLPGEKKTTQKKCPET